MPSLARKILDGVAFVGAVALWGPSQARAMVLPFQSRKLHFGCGKNRLAGWINADIVPTADLIVFMQARLPFRSGSLERVYSEHVLEHAPRATGVAFLSEVHRVLAPGGVARVAMPDLDALVDAYINDWKRLDWVHWPGHESIRTRGDMLNAAFRWWGHRYLYNREDLDLALREAGFDDIEIVAHGQSRHDDLVGLETRQDSFLIMEATRR